jgi:hypothetical protein
MGQSWSEKVFDDREGNFKAGCGSVQAAFV